MVWRLALALTVLGLASQATASLLLVDYDFSNGGNYNFGGQAVAVTGGMVRFDFHGGGQPTVGGTLQPGAVTLKTMNVSLGNDVQLNPGFSFNRWGFKNQFILGELLDFSLRPDGGIQIFSKSGVQGTAWSAGGSSMPIMIQVRFGFADNRIAVGLVKYMSLGGDVNPTFTFFAGGQEIARMLVPEPTPGWLLAAACAAVLAIFVGGPPQPRG